MPIANSQDYSCPRCGQVDMVQKVSALVEVGTVAGVYTNPGGIRVSGVTLSAKASQLVLPPRPIFKKRSPLFVSLIIVVVGWVLALYFLYLFIAFFYALTATGLPISPLESFGGLVFLAILIVACLIIGPVVMRRRKKSYLALRAQHQLDVSRWEHKKDNWNKLYYCARNDVVFFPGDPLGWAPASEMLKLL